MTNRFYSIKTINQILFTWIISINLMFLSLKNLHDFQLLFIWLNIIFLIAYIVFNYSYEKELNKEKSDIKEILNKSWNGPNKDINKILQKKLKYKENNETYKLFKNMYLRKNLANKDFDDLKWVFYKFIPEDLLKEVTPLDWNKLALWISIKKYLNVMFLDIIWFTKISEHMQPEKALLLLNVYFDWIVEIIKDNWGYIDKYLWDWIMIIFNSKNSDSAIKAAVEIQEFMSKIQITEAWRRISIWIWINSWEVILWTIWSKNRMELTIIWDTVNTASRLEWLTRKYKEKIIISEETHKVLKDKSKYNIREIWEKHVKWKKDWINIFWLCVKR